MKTILLENVNVLHFDYKGQFFYGASQTMYRGFVKKMSGCGPTVASNMFTYISKTDDNYHNLYLYNMVNSENMEKHMQNIWQYITPSSRGVDKTSIFEEGAIKYINEVGLQNKIIPETYNVIYKEKKPNEYTEVTKFIKKHIENNAPVAFLNLDNGEVRNLHKWHWLLIVGITFDNNNLFAIIYDEGRKITVDLKLFLETSKMDNGFIGFKKIIE